MRKSRLGLLKVEAETQPKVEAKKETKKKVEYVDILPSKELEIADGIKLVFSVSCSSEGTPHLDIRTWVESEKYTGPTKKGINFDIENLEEFKTLLEEIDNELEKRGV